MKFALLTICFIAGCALTVFAWGTPAAPVAVAALIFNAIFYGVNLLASLKPSEATERGSELSEAAFKICKWIARQCGWSLTRADWQKMYNEKPK